MMLVRRSIARPASIALRAKSRTASLFDQIAEGGSVNDVNPDLLKEMYEYESMDVYVRDRMKPDTKPDPVGTAFDRLNKRSTEWLTMGSKMTKMVSGPLEDAWKAPAEDPVLSNPTKWNRDMMSSHISPPRHKPAAITTVGIEDLYAANVHMGHSRSVWNPRMAPYIHSVRNKLHIIDVQQTLVMLRRAMNVVREVSAMNGVVVFVAMRPQLQDVVKMLALHCEQYFVYQRWTPGTITNPRRVLKVDVYQPDLMVFLDPLNAPVAIKEANASDIPTMGICDTNMDPTLLTYPIPGNDDGLESILLLGSQLSNAALEGRERYKRSPQGRAEIAKKGDASAVGSGAAAVADKDADEYAELLQNVQAAPAGFKGALKSSGSLGDLLSDRDVGLDSDLIERLRARGIDVHGEASRLEQRIGQIADDAGQTSKIRPRH